MLRMYTDALKFAILISFVVVYETFKMRLLIKCFLIPKFFELCTFIDFSEVFLGYSVDGTAIFFWFLGDHCNLKGISSNMNKYYNEMVLCMLLSTR